MNPDEKLSLPFVTRKMLSFEHALAFELEYVGISNSTTKIDIIGITREGMFKFTHTHAGDGNEESVQFKIPDIPIFLSVTVPSGSVSAGQHFARLYLRANDERILRLASGYVTTQDSLNYPEAQSGKETTGGGNFKSVLGSNPAAGAEATITVPTNELWYVHGFGVTLVTDGTAANRRPGLEVLGWGGTNALQFYSTTDITASLTTKCNFFPGADLLGAIVNSNIQVSIPPVIIADGGSVIRTKTLNLQAGDDYGIPQIFVEQYMWAPA